MKCNEVMLSPFSFGYIKTGTAFQHKAFFDTRGDRKTDKEKDKVDCGAKLAAAAVISDADGMAPPRGQHREPVCASS